MLRVTARPGVDIRTTFRRVSSQEPEPLGYVLQGPDAAATVALLEVEVAFGAVASTAGLDAAAEAVLVVGCQVSADGEVEAAYALTAPASIAGEAEAAYGPLSAVVALDASAEAAHGVDSAAASSLASLEAEGAHEAPTTQEGSAEAAFQDPLASLGQAALQEAEGIADLNAPAAQEAGLAEATAASQQPENLFQNPALSEWADQVGMPDGWEKVVVSGAANETRSGERPSELAATVHSLPWALVLTMPGGTTTATFGLRRPVTVTAGQAYRARAWLRFPTAKPTVHFRVFDSGGSTLQSYAPVLEPVFAAGVWQPYEFEVASMPAGAASAGVTVAYTGLQSSAAFDDLSLWLGSEPAGLAGATSIGFAPSGASSEVIVEAAATPHQAPASVAGEAEAIHALEAAAGQEAALEASPDAIQSQGDVGHSAEAAGDVESPGAAALAAAEADAEVQAQATQVGAAEVEGLQGPSGQGAAALQEAEATGQATSAASIGTTTVETGDRICGKDTFARTDKTIGVCNEDLTHDGEDVRVTNLLAGKRDGYVAWDLSIFPAGATVTAAELVLNVEESAALGANISLFKILDASEGWDEATLKCSNAPAADGASLQTINVPDGTTGDRRFALNSSWLSRLGARMGVGACTILLRMDSIEAASRFSDKESGSGVGPRLKLTFQVA